jgi:hypothetical protein
MLYHFSEEPGIKTFHPRSPQGSPDTLPYVWAIDEEHQVNYYFPRNCPRIIYRMSAGITEPDKESFFSGTGCSTIITIEEKWLDRLNTAEIYRYSFFDTGFKVIDKTAGYYISNNEVEPIIIERFGNLPERIRKKNAELRLTDNLRALEKQILNSSIKHFSMIRLRTCSS